MDLIILVPEFSYLVLICITKTRLFKYIESFTTKKGQFSDSSDKFHIPAQNIDYGYTLESPPRGGSNKYQTASARRF